MDAQEPEVVGLIGAGRLGQAMARTALLAGRRVIIANSRGPDSLTGVVSELGDRASRDGRDHSWHDTLRDQRALACAGTARPSARRAYEDR